MMVVDSSPSSVEKVMMAPAMTPGSMRGTVMRVEVRSQDAPQAYKTGVRSAPRVSGEARARSAIYKPPGCALSGPSVC